MKIIIVVLLLLCLPQMCFAGAIQAVQQQKAMQQQAVQKAIAERQIQAQVKRNVITQMPPQAIQLPRAADSEIQQVSDMTEILESLKYTSRIWPLIADMEPKIFIVVQHMKLFQENGITVTKPAPFYVSTVDSMIQQNPAIINQPFINILQTAAIIEYDFDNGQDKDKLARELLDHDAYVENRRRHGLY
ncbi:MAG: hypothetical protein P9M07_02215 [Candidatus Aceula meridiana]|nr:hypothetical protein [Candidatus Aceula meridiana]